MSERPPARQKPDPSSLNEINFAVELAGMKATNAGMKSDLDSLDSRFGALETEMRRGFNALADSITRLTAPKGAPWQMISIIVGLGLALGSWANTYFGQGITAAHRAVEVAQAKQSKLEDRIEQMNASVTSHAIDAADKAGYGRATQELTAKEQARIRADLDKIGTALKLTP